MLDANSVYAPVNVRIVEIRAARHSRCLAELKLEFSFPGGHIVVDRELWNQTESAALAAFEEWEKHR